MKKISVIISVYNGEKYLKECLKSLENQTMNSNDFETIIINDGSKDNSINIIKKFIEKNSNWFLIDRENKGLSCSRNEGLEIFNGEFVTFFDCDDILECDALENMYNEIRENKCEIGIFRAIRFNEISEMPDGYETRLNQMKKITNINETPFLAYIVRSGSILYKRNIINDIRFIPNVVHEDNYFCIKAYCKARRIYISERSVYRIRRNKNETNSITNNLNFKTYKDLVKNISTADFEIRNNRLIKIHTNQMLGYINRNVNDEHKQEAVELLRQYLLDLKDKKIISRTQYICLIFYLKFKRVLTYKKL